MRILISLIGLCIPLVSMANTYVFVSFSMPEKLLIETLQESVRLQIPATFNGLYQDSMLKTANQVMLLSQQVPNLQLQIDPIAFEKYSIRQVPALVVTNNECFDVIYGTLPLAEGLDRIKSRGECQDGAQ